MGNTTGSTRKKKGPQAPTDQPPTDQPPTTGKPETAPADADLKRHPPSSGSPYQNGPTREPMTK